MKKVGEEERIYPRWVPKFEGYFHLKTIPIKISFFISTPSTQPQP